MAPLSVLAAFAATSDPIAAQTLLKAFNTEDCPERTVHRWCASHAKRDGWAVTHRDESRPDMMDVSWLYEIWRRDRDVVLCMYSGGRGGDRVNLCRVMDEVQ